MDIKLEINRMFGEKVTELFSNSAGKVHEEEITSKFSFKEIVEIQDIVISRQFQNLKESVLELKLMMALDFLESIEKIAVDIYGHYERIAQIEKGEDKKAVLYKIAQELVQKDKAVFKKEIVDQIQKTERVRLFFYEEMLDNKMAADLPKEEVEDAIIRMSGICAGFSLLENYNKTHELPFVRFRTFFSVEEKELTTNIIHDIQQGVLV